MRICLVNMPFVGLNRPSIALGLLQSVLQHARWDVKSFYFNIPFAQRIGLDRYEAIQEVSFPGHALGEWIFGSSAFPDFEPCDEDYFQRLLSENEGLRRFDPGELKQSLFDIREQATRFVDGAAQRVLEQRPRIVGCTSMFQQHAASLALLRRIRELAPQVLTLMGGANCETVMGQTTHRNFRWVDYVVSGEADGLIVQLCEKMLSGGRGLAPEDLPAGVFGPSHRERGYPGAQGLVDETLAVVNDVPPCRRVW